VKSAHILGIAIRPGRRIADSVRCARARTSFITQSSGDGNTLTRDFALSL